MSDVDDNNRTLAYRKPMVSGVGIPGGRRTCVFRVDGRGKTGSGLRIVRVL